VLNCGALGTNDYYDVSAVDGFTFPVRVDVTAQSSAVLCNNNSGNNPLQATQAFVDGSMLDLSSCPTEDDLTVYSTGPGTAAVDRRRDQSADPVERVQPA